MLPLDIADRISEFQRAIDRLQQTADPQKPNSALLRETFGEVQQIFQNDIAILGEDSTNSTTSPRMRSYITEMDKQLRLMSIDVTFLQAARQSATVQGRLTQIGDRLRTLKNYCLALAATSSSSSEPKPG